MIVDPLLRSGLRDVTWCGMSLKYKPVSWDEAEDISIELVQPFRLNGQDGKYLLLHSEFLDFADGRNYESVRICVIMFALSSHIFSCTPFCMSSFLQFQKWKPWYFGFQLVLLQSR
jgi:hypothetical protein